METSIDSNLLVSVNQLHADKKDENDTTKKDENDTTKKDKNRTTKKDCPPTANTTKGVQAHLPTQFALLHTLHMICKKH